MPKIEFEADKETLKLIENIRVDLDDYNKYLKWYTKKYCFFNRVGINYEKQELILLDVNRIVYKFDIENDIARWFYPEALYAKNLDYVDPDYDGEVLTYESKKDHPFMVVYDELYLEGDGNILFRYTGKLVQWMDFPRLLMLADDYAGIKTNFECAVVDPKEKPTNVDGCDKIVDFVIFSDEGDE